MRWEWYDKNLLPQGVDQTCAETPFMDQRKLVVPEATGAVLELGSGSGLNLAFYDKAKVQKVYALDPSPEMHALAKPRVEKVELPVELIEAPAEKVPLDKGSVDTVLVTYTLCTVEDPGAALAEVRRVLKPGGKLIFLEHGTSPDKWVRFWQDVMNPVWAFFSGGCQLNRYTPEVLEKGGFQIDDLKTGYIKGWRPLNYNFWGTASAK